MTIQHSPGSTFREAIWNSQYGALLVRKIGNSLSIVYSFYPTLVELTCSSTGPSVRVESETIVTLTREAADCVHTFLLTSVNVCGAFVHIWKSAKGKRVFNLYEIKRKIFSVVFCHFSTLTICVQIHWFCTFSALLPALYRVSCRALFWSNEPSL